MTVNEIKEIFSHKLVVEPDIKIVFGLDLSNCMGLALDDPTW